MRINSRKTLLRCGTVLAVSLIAMKVAAQPVAPAAVASDTAGSDTEIVITAEKRVSNLETTAVAASVVSNQDMTARQIATLGSLISTVPGVQFDQIQGQARINIRGIGFDAITFGSEARIAYSIDGVYVSRPAAQMGAFFDIDRVEVVRGPQGTLDGRNATGGAVNVITEGPTDDRKGYFTVGAGNYGSYKFEGAIGGPFNADIDSRFSFQALHHDGYGRDETTNIGIDDLNSWAARGELKFKLPQNFTFLVTGDYRQEDDHADNYIYLGPSLANVRPSALNLGGTFATSPRDSASPLTPLNRRRSYGVTGQLNGDIGPVSFTSITGYRYSNLFVLQDVSQSTLLLNANNYIEQSNQVSQEFRFSEDFKRGSWLVGVYYLHEDIFGGTQSALSSAVLSAANPVSPLRQGVYDMGDLATDAYAGFGQLRFNFTDQLTLSAGVRYSWERKADADVTFSNFVATYTGPTFAFPPAGHTPLDQSDSWGNFSPKISLEYKPTRGVFLYATYAEGFKSGGYNLGNSQPPYAPETLNDYEVGAKFDGLDGRLRANLSAFYYDYKNLQVTVIRLTGVATTLSEILNAAKSRIYGVEGDFTASPVRNLVFDGSVSLLNSEYTAFSTVDPLNVAAGAQNLSGRQLTEAPRYTINFGGQYTWQTSGGDFTVRGEGRFVGLTYFTPFNYPVAAQPAYSLFNAFLTYDPPHKPWELRAFVRNIADARILDFASPSTALFGFPLIGDYAPPRTFGVEWEARF